MYKSQFPKIDPYDWFCGPGSQIAFQQTHLKNSKHTCIFFYLTPTDELMTSWYSFMEYTVAYTSEILARPSVTCLQFPEHSGTFSRELTTPSWTHIREHTISSGLNVLPLPDSCSSMLISFPMWMESLSCCCLRKRTLRPGNTHSSLHRWPKYDTQLSHTDLNTSLEVSVW